MSFLTAEKRKSAVELLRETKPLYIKSEMVLYGEQESQTNSNATPILQMPLILPSPPPLPSSTLLSSFSRKSKYEIPSLVTDTNSVSDEIVDQFSNVTTHSNNKCNYDDANKTAFQARVDVANDASPSSSHDSHSFSHRTSLTIGTSSGNFFMVCSFCINASF